MRRCCCCFLAFQSLVSLLLLVASLLCVVELTEDAPALNYTEVPIQSEQPPLLWWIWNAEWLSCTDYRWTALLSLLGCDQGTVRHIQTQIFFFPSIYSCGGGSRPPTGVYSGVSSQSILCPGTNTFTTASAGSISAQRIDKLLYLCWHLSLNPGQAVHSFRTGLRLRLFISQKSKTSLTSAPLTLNFPIITSQFCWSAAEWITVTV